MAVSDYFTAKPPTLDQMAAERGAVPKHLIPTKVDRAKEKKADERKDALHLAVWAKTVKGLDSYVDRYDKKPVHKTTEADPRRAEAHHIAGRADSAVRYDVRNGITLAWENHEKVERGELQILGTRFFKVNGKKYINGRFQVKWKVNA